jgi:anti-anti-sigma regulatory factor
MTGQLAIEAELTHPIALLRAHGVLDAYSAVGLRDGLHEALYEQPVALLLDVRDLIVADDIALTVLANVAAQAQRWPGTRIALCGADQQILSAAERLGATAGVATYPDERAALHDARRWPVPPSARAQIDPDRFAPAIAREALQRFCTAYGVVSDTSPLELVASELVTNAVIHAGTPIDLAFRLADPLVHIAVRDRGDGQVRLAEVVEEGAEHGRGLLLVDALAHAWGTLASPTGKTVWASMRVRVGSPLTSENFYQQSS